MRRWAQPHRLGFFALRNGDGSLEGPPRYSLGVSDYWTVKVAVLLATVCVLAVFFEPDPEPRPVCATTE